jgi:phenylpropionate dioxygenase-like ring-hydroxylating dioxygenase large terminal subunit
VRRRELLWDFWYLACPSKDLARGGLVGKTIIGEQILVGRAADGKPFALRDHCPHRAMPLRHGRLVDGTVECCYHGWRFGVDDGRCRLIPALTAADTVKIERIGVPTYPCREIGGHVWVFLAEHDREAGADDLPPVPGADTIGDLEPLARDALVFPCHVDWAAIGLMDPAHAAFVHTSWWWRRGKRILREKEKPFGPIEHGYRMGPFEMKSTPRPYRLLGEHITSEIRFTLPGVRVEVIRGEKNTAIDLTAITPLDDAHTEVFHAVYTTARGLWWLVPFGRRMIRTFLEQDRDVVVKQQPALEREDSMMFVGDADQEARWYFALKTEYLESREQGRAFKNPVEPCVLHWRS